MSSLSVIETKISHIQNTYFGIVYDALKNRLVDIEELIKSVKDKLSLR